MPNRIDNNYVKTYTSGRAPIQDARIIQLPDKTKYRPGEAVSYDGLQVVYAGQDVTSKVTFDFEEGSTWRKALTRREVHVTYVDQYGQAHGAMFVLSERKPLLPIIITLLVAVVVAIGGIFAYNYFAAQQQPTDDGTGISVIPQGDMTDEEAAAAADAKTEASRITVSVRPNQELKDGQLHINFMVIPPNNGYSERIEIEQDGKIVYSSPAVEPGYMIEWVPAPDAKVGDATATVYAVDPSNGLDHGNPAAVEVQIVLPEEQG